MNQPTEHSIAEVEQHMHQVATRPREEPSTGELLAAVIRQGVTTSSVEVIERLCAVRDKERAQANKAEFNRAFFALKKEISGMEFYADKAAKTSGGDVAYTYCSEAEISNKLEPVLFKHGLAMLFGQRKDGEHVTAEIAIIHESGHEEKREYTVALGKVNSMKDATAVVVGSTTAAWRHLVIKLFGLKSRIREEDDARNVGTAIPRDKAAELRARVKACGASASKFLVFAHSCPEDEVAGGENEVAGRTFEDIGSARLEDVERMLRHKEKAHTETQTK